MPIKVLIVDDSALMRQVLTDILRQDEEIEVVAAASDPYTAWEKIKTFQPDVLTLDVEMPKMDGLTFLDKLMHAKPLPVLMVSTLTQRGCTTTLRALELGAVDFVTKPRLDISGKTFDMAAEIIDKVRACSLAKVRARYRPAQRPVDRNLRRTPTMFAGTHKVLCIGASTGGTEALFNVLTELPADAPGTVIVQHMPAGFTRNFAERLNQNCLTSVKEAADGDRILPGHVLIAPGGLHMAVERSGANYSVRVFQSEPVNRHRPSVDVLFRSAAQQLGRNAIGVILTGMGDDGALGMRAMHDVGAHTIAQDEATCVVFGMPKEAIAAGGVDEVLPLDRIAMRITGLVRSA